MASVEVLVDQHCFWIHTALTIPEQIEVFADLLERSKHVDNSKRPCMNPSPKTLLFDGRVPTLRFGRSRDIDENGNETNLPLDSVYDRLILRKAVALLTRCRCLDQSTGESNDNVASHIDKTNNVQSKHFGYNRYSIGVIRYGAPNERFPEHIDHCNDPNGWVILLSLGCTAKFTVRGSKDAPKRVIDLASGSVLVFDPSSNATIQHGVASILPSTCPEALVRAFGKDMMANNRYGVQCRTSLQINTPE